MYCDDTSTTFGSREGTICVKDKLSHEAARDHVHHSPPPASGSQCRTYPGLAGVLDDKGLAEPEAQRAATLKDIPDLAVFCPETYSSILARQQSRRM